MYVYVGLYIFVSNTDGGEVLEGVAAGIDKIDSEDLLYVKDQTAAARITLCKWLKTKRSIRKLQGSVLE